MPSRRLIAAAHPLAFLSERTGCRLGGSHFDITVFIVWIQEKIDDGRLRCEVACMIGLKSGKVESCDTFSAAEL
jgi:hypothetical protein